MTALQNLLFRERAFSLFLTAHRVGDLRRLVRQYGRGAESVFPSGARFIVTPVRDPKTNKIVPGAAESFFTFGPDVNFPVPFDEQNNPQFHGCLNRDA